MVSMHTARQDRGRLVSIKTIGEDCVISAEPGGQPARDGDWANETPHARAGHQLDTIVDRSIAVETTDTDTRICDVALRHESQCRPHSITPPPGHGSGASDGEPDGVIGRI